MIDLDGTYAAWFDRLGARYAVFYVAATAADRALREQLDVLLSIMCLTERTPDSTPVA